MRIFMQIHDITVLSQYFNEHYTFGALNAYTCTLCVVYAFLQYQIFHRCIKIHNLFVSYSLYEMTGF